MEIKTKIIEDGAISCCVKLDTKINKFIEENNIKVIDIKFTSVNGRAAALIIYEVKAIDDVSYTWPNGQRYVDTDLIQAKCEEQEKVLEIIKKKQVDVEYLSKCNDVKEYNAHWCYEKFYLTQEEFDLLKRC